LLSEHMYFPAISPFLSDWVTYTVASSHKQYTFTRVYKCAYKLTRDRKLQRTRLNSATHVSYMHTLRVSTLLHVHRSKGSRKHLLHVLKLINERYCTLIGQSLIY